MKFLHMLLQARFGCESIGTDFTNKWLVTTIPSHVRDQVLLAGEFLRAVSTGKRLLLTTVLQVTD